MERAPLGELHDLLWPRRSDGEAEASRRPLGHERRRRGLVQGKLPGLPDAERRHVAREAEPRDRLGRDAGEPRLLPSADRQAGRASPGGPLDPGVGAPARRGLLERQAHLGGGRPQGLDHAGAAQGAPGPGPHLGGGAELHQLPVPGALDHSLPGGVHEGLGYGAAGGFGLGHEGLLARALQGGAQGPAAGGGGELDQGAAHLGRLLRPGQPLVRRRRVRALGSLLLHGPALDAVGQGQPARGLQASKVHALRLRAGDGAALPAGGRRGLPRPRLRWPAGGPGRLLQRDDGVLRPSCLEGRGQIHLAAS
mmetsp:Transcript_134921/g.419257  ORF Transcript_134921/g.419257 Transcript_134921/m.419257 type:complete len:309 (+) Transcript_134921:324-1250(+)